MKLKSPFTFKIVAIQVLRVIRKNAARENRKMSNQPFVKVIVLQGALILCALFQIVAVGFGALSAISNPMSLVYDFLNSLGILIFTILTLCLYHPTFNLFNNHSTKSNTVSSIQEKNQITSARPKHLDSTLGSERLDSINLSSNAILMHGDQDSTALSENLPSSEVIVENTEKVDHHVEQV